MIAIHGPGDGGVLRAELWLCSLVWCALRMGYGPGLVSGAAAAGCLVETILTSAADFVAVTEGHQFGNLAPRQPAVNAVLRFWHPVGTAGMGASVSGRHERLAALVMPTGSGNTWALPQ